MEKEVKPYYESSNEEKQAMDVKARCESVGGKMGYLKCFKDGKEIKK